MGVDTAKQERIPWVVSDKRFINGMFNKVLRPMENREWTSGGSIGNNGCMIKSRQPQQYLVDQLCFLLRHGTQP